VVRANFKLLTSAIIKLSGDARQNRHRKVGPHPPNLMSNNDLSSVFSNFAPFDERTNI